LSTVVANSIWATKTYIGQQLSNKYTKKKDIGQQKKDECLL